MKRRLRPILFGGVIWLGVQWLVIVTAKVLFKLADNAIFGWGDDLIARWFDIKAPTEQAVLGALLVFGPAPAITMIGLWGYHKWTIAKYGPPPASASDTSVVPLPSSDPPNGASGDSPFASIVLLYDVANKSITEVKRENVRTAVVTSEQIENYLVHDFHRQGAFTAFIAFEHKGPVRVVSVMNGSSLYCNVIDQGEEFVRFKFTPLISTGLPQSGEIHLQFFSQP